MKHEQRRALPPTALLNIEKPLPQHIAIIMDGNRRWAQNRGLPSTVGHWYGADALSKLVAAASCLEIKVLTVYAFSTENWSRTPDEVSSIMQLFHMYLMGNKDRMVQEGVRLKTIGDLSRLPHKIQTTLDEIKKATLGGAQIDLVLAINYGARDDIRRAIIAIIEDHQQGRIQKQEITEALISRYLDTSDWQDPELLIRTGGEHRLSNFLLWQLSYTEVYITDVLWPDFDKHHLEKAIEEFQKRKRRLGC